MILVDLTAWALFLYLTLYVIYRFVIIFNSSRGRMADIQKREYEPKIERKLTVLIYSHNNSSKVKNLIESFSRQTYNSEKYSVNVILDNCDSENTKLLEIMGGVRLWRINTNVKPIGKYKSFAWLLERIRAFENTNAFVFLDGDCMIKVDLLEKINASLSENAVVVGETLKRKKFFLNKLINFKNKITNRVIRHGRFHTGLGNFIDTNILVIKQDLLEKINFEVSEFGFEEYEYPIRLKYFNIPVLYSSDIVVYNNKPETIKSLAIKEYKRRTRAFKTFQNNFITLFSMTRLSVKEQVLSLVYPSGTLFVFWNSLLLFISLAYPATSFASLIPSKIVAMLLVLKFMSDFQSLIAIRSNLYEYYHAFQLFFLSPVIYVRSVLVGFSSFPQKKEKPVKYKANSSNFEKNTVEARITNGKSEFPCILEISKSDENATVTFIFKDKKLKSSKQPRTCYAVEEIVSKLKTHGFSLKVCSNCGYFHLTESSVAHTDGEQGYCLYKNFKENSKEKEFTPAWSYCNKIIPSQARNYIRQEMGLEKK